jgi:tRNA-specific 2-thiouridylase
VVSADGDGWRLELATPARGIAPGQAAVLYDGDRVLASATMA